MIIKKELITKKELDKLIKTVVDGVGQNPLSGVEMSDDDWKKLPQRTKENLVITFKVTHYLNFKTFTKK